MTRCSRWKCQNVKTLQSMTTIECNNVTLKQSFAILISIFGIALKITSELFLSTPNNYRISKYVSCTILFLMKCSLASWNRVKLVSNLNNETRELFHDVTSWYISLKLNLSYHLPQIIKQFTQSKHAIYFKGGW